MCNGWNFDPMTFQGHLVNFRGQIMFCAAAQLSSNLVLLSIRSLIISLFILKVMWLIGHMV